MAAPISPKPESLFQHIKSVMQTPADFDPGYPAPWTEDEFEAFAGQEPLPPNQGFMLPSEEQPTEEPNQIHLQLT